MSHQRATFKSLLKGFGDSMGNLKGLMSVSSCDRMPFISTVQSIKLCVCTRLYAGVLFAFQLSLKTLTFTSSS